MSNSSPQPAGDARSVRSDTRPRGTPRGRNQRGEGVISTAIAVLIVAFLGIALWTGFDRIMDNASQRTETEVNRIGSP